jgi:hypothetical protein
MGKLHVLKQPEQKGSVLVTRLDPCFELVERDAIRIL